MSDFAKDLESRFVRYCAIDSQADDKSGTHPSSSVQIEMGKVLEQELREIGASDVTRNDHGAVLATIPGNRSGPTIAFMAHMDTTPQFNATGVKPRVIRTYDGGDIRYPDNASLVLSPEQVPYLSEKVGDTIVTASGTTLLGADDKAGVAIVMTAAKHLIDNPDLPHGPIRICFTTDEEIGKGVYPALVQEVGADFAYTFDGQKVGEIEFETFSADEAIIRIEGVSIHPGLAKDQLVNAVVLASRFVAALPRDMSPETTEGREGYVHATEISGGSSEVVIRVIIRDYELDGLAAKGQMIQDIAAELQAFEPRAKISCSIRAQYRNMRYWLEKDKRPVDLAERAMIEIGQTPKFTAFRGGTDGSRFTEMGLPCPNLFAGMQEIHGPLEWVSVQDMEVAVALMLKIAELGVGTSE
ncbi:peptidase T [Tianweitania sp.]|uniref:peptidase T n=1 Tax=Tianweitania sp. TaxID=2021634 RepID=UPI002899CD29|nr:peptidase T [Tianweitania sp.]